jgi:hypothetical protein
MKANEFSGRPIVQSKLPLPIRTASVLQEAKKPAESHKKHHSTKRSQDSLPAPFGIDDPHGPVASRIKSHKPGLWAKVSNWD